MHHADESTIEGSLHAASVSPRIDLDKARGSLDAENARYPLLLHDLAPSQDIGGGLVGQARIFGIGLSAVGVAEEHKATVVVGIEHYLVAFAHFMAVDVSAPRPLAHQRGLDASFGSGHHVA